MKIACSCMVMVLLLAGCATTGTVDQMIDTKMTSQADQINSKFEAQAMASAAILEEMKSFTARLGTALDRNVKAVEADVGAVQSQLAAVKKNVSGIQSDIGKLESKTGQVKTPDAGGPDLSAIDSLKGKVAALNASVDALEKAEKARVAAEAAAAEAKAALPAKGLFHKHPAGVVE